MSLRSCDHARPLIPRYLDGELAEAEAGPLRRHLLSCQGCRMTTQDDKALRRWFQAEEPVPVPQGFAARVARLAHAGAVAEDGGVSTVERRLPALAAAAPASTEREASLLPFVLRLTAAAALVLIALSGFLREAQIATEDGLSANDATTPTLEELDSLLEQLAEPEAATPAAEDAAR